MPLAGEPLAGDPHAGDPRGLTPNMLAAVSMSESESRNLGKRQFAKVWLLLECDGNLPCLSDFLAVCLVHAIYCEEIRESVC